MSRLTILAPLTLITLGACGSAESTETAEPPPSSTSGAAEGQRSPSESEPGPPAEPEIAQAPPAEPAPPTDDDLRAALAPALEAGNDGRELALSFRPEAADFDAVFVEGSAATLRDATIDLFDDPRARITPGSAARTEILIRSATTEELAAQGEAAGGLPGGMTRIAPHLQPGVRWYHVKFVEPGQTSGMSLAAFVYSGGRWLWFPKPWHHLD